MPIPTEINLHKKSKVLSIKFDDDVEYNLSCEFLRVHSPSAEVQGHGPGQGVLQLGKEDVTIEKIDPVGNYAVCLHFDDGHKTGIFSWDTLYNMGNNYNEIWQDYLKKLEEKGYERKTNRLGIKPTKEFNITPKEL
ncbi:MAG: DUF971 domain-containing protein [Methylococcales bacterium]|jgi:DUF971 family protein|nr:DUF971 domain-containing protein [Methylococcales bacterium]MBT7410480.1 DUF971 domain-containing protein [Methylococcales bacterium]